MSTCLVPRTSGLALSALIALTSTACVDAYGGSALALTLDSNVERPAAPGVTPSGAQAPAGTFFSLYAMKYEYASCDACPSGTTCDTDSDLCLDDATSQPATTDSFAFKVTDFELRPLILINSPCFIEGDRRPYPGLHSTREVNRIALDFGIPLSQEGEPILPDDIDHGVEIDIITADVRRDFHPALQNTLTAMVAFSNAQAPGVHPAYQVGTVCVDEDDTIDPNLIPPARCIRDGSNARRKAICERYFEEFPNYYVGTDTVFTDPLGGEWFGAVTGTNPKNGVGFLDGSQFLVDTALNDFDAVLLQWQFKDINGDGEPDYPDTFTPQQRSQIGFHFMEGTPVIRTRNTVNVPLANRTFPVSGEAAFFTDLREDDVHF